MNPTTRTVARAVLMAAIAVVATTPRAIAECKNARLVSTVLPDGPQSYILTPGVTPGASESSITEHFEAFFWALGAGAPAFASGVDSGTFTAIGAEDSGWVHRPLGYPAYLHTTWSARKEIDGFIDTENIQRVHGVASLRSGRR